MKTATVVFLALAFMSCKQQFGKRSLLGSWITRDFVNLSKKDVVHRLTFQENDSVTVEDLIDGVVIYSYKGTFRVQPDSQLLYTKFQKVSEKIRIPRWDYKSLEFHNLTFNKIERYKRQ